MEQSSHNRKVEKAMKDALRNDRARIQVGRISSFGLMEMSRQRLRTGVLEASTRPCAHCEGTGLMRTASSAGLSALRLIEDEAARGRGDRICLRAGREAAIYVLNKKRAELAEIEERFGVQVEVLVDESFEGARMAVDSAGNRPVAPVRAPSPPIIDDVDDEIEDEVEIEDDEVEDEEESAREDRSERSDRSPREDGERGRGRRRRRRGGRGRSRGGEGSEGGEGHVDDQRDAAISEEDAESSGEPQEAAPRTAEDGDDQPRRSRRGRRGGRGGRRERGYEGDAPVIDGEVANSAPDATPLVEPVPSIDPPAADETVEPIAEDAPKTRRRPRARKADDAVAEPVVKAIKTAAAPAPELPSEPVTEDDAKPKRRSRAKKVPEVELADATPAEPAPADTPVASNDTADGPAEKPRSGWWARTFS